MNTFQDRFYRFQLECTLARHYTLAAELVSVGDVPPNPLIDSLLPSMLHVKAVALLNEALTTEAESKGITLPLRGYGASLHGRISVLADSGSLPESKQLHEVRDRRNDIAHESERYVTWSELDADLDTVHRALTRLGYARPVATLTVQGERLPCDNPDSEGVLFAFDYRIEVLENGKAALLYAWRSEILDDDGFRAHA